MKKSVRNSIQTFIIMFFILEVLPFVFKGDSRSIGEQTVIIALFSIAIGIRNYKLKKR